MASAVEKEPEGEFSPKKAVLAANGMLPKIRLRTNVFLTESHPGERARREGLELACAVKAICFA
jgi:hypothetical protein